MAIGDVAWWFSLIENAVRRSVVGPREKGEPHPVHKLHFAAGEARLEIAGFLSRADFEDLRHG